MVSQTGNLVTFAQAALILGVSRPTIYAWVRLGRLATLPVAGKRLIILTGELPNKFTAPARD